MTPSAQNVRFTENFWSIYFMFALETTILVSLSISFSYIRKNKLEIIIITKKSWKIKTLVWFFYLHYFLIPARTISATKVRLTKNSLHNGKNNARATSFGLRSLQFVSCISWVWEKFVMNTQILRTFSYHLWNNIINIKILHP